MTLYGKTMKLKNSLVNTSFASRYSNPTAIYSYKKAIKRQDSRMTKLINNCLNLLAKQICFLSFSIHKTTKKRLNLNVRGGFRIKIQSPKILKTNKKGKPLRKTKHYAT